MKIGQTVTFSDDTMTVRTRHTATPAIEAARVMRDAGKESLGESKAIAVVPGALIVQWARKHGVDLTDSHAMAEVVDKELADPANSMFRVWGGTY
jgi:cell envelope opacity-associated protein A